MKRLREGLCTGLGSRVTPKRDAERHRSQQHWEGGGAREGAAPPEPGVLKYVFIYLAVPGLSCGM